MGGSSAHYSNCPKPCVTNQISLKFSKEFATTENHTRLILDFDQDVDVVDSLMDRKGIESPSEQIGRETSILVTGGNRDEKLEFGSYWSVLIIIFFLALALDWLFQAILKLKQITH